MNLSFLDLNKPTPYLTAPGVLGWALGLGRGWVQGRLERLAVCLSASGRRPVASTWKVDVGLSHIWVRWGLSVSVCECECVWSSGEGPLRTRALDAPGGGERSCAAAAAQHHRFTLALGPAWLAGPAGPPSLTCVSQPASSLGSRVQVGGPLRGLGPLAGRRDGGKAVCAKTAVLTLQ